MIWGFREVTLGLRWVIWGLRLVPWGLERSIEAMREYLGPQGKHFRKEVNIGSQGNHLEVPGSSPEGMTREKLSFIFQILYFDIFYNIPSSSGPISNYFV